MGPIITRIRNWFSPEVPPPSPEPLPTPAPEPDAKIPEPSRIQVLNFIRALMILRNAPFKELSAEFAKLPHKKIAYAIGAIIWVFMSYTFLKYLLGL
jgi:hypothetical protein